MSSKRKKMPILKLPDSVTEIIKIYVKDLIPHSFVFIITVVILLSIGFVSEKNIRDKPEHKNVVTVLMSFNILIFLLIYRYGNISTNLFSASLLYIGFSSAVIALVNLDKISYDKLPDNIVSWLMFAQVIFTLLTIFAKYW